MGAAVVVQVQEQDEVSQREVSLSSVFREAEAHKGALTAEMLTALDVALTDVRVGADYARTGTGGVGPAAEEHAVQVTAAEAALKAAREAARAQRVQAETARVWITRYVVLVGTADVTGTRSLTQREIASRLGVSQPRVSHMISDGRFVRSLPGQPWSAASLTAARVAREQGTVETVKAAAIASADKRASDVASERVKGGDTATVPVKVTGGDLSQAIRSAVPVVPFTASKVRQTVETWIARGVKGTDEETADLIKSLQVLVSALS